MNKAKWENVFRKERKMIKYIGKQVREKKGFTLNELSNRTGLSKDTFNAWENGRRLPRLEALDLVAVALGVSPWQLIEFNNEMEEN